MEHGAHRCICVEFYNKPTHRPYTSNVLVTLTRIHILNGITNCVAPKRRNIYRLNRIVFDAYAEYN